MNMLDIIIGIPIIWMAYRGFSKGFVIEVTTLIALLLGIYIAINFSFYTSDLIRDYFTIEEKYMSILSFAVTFVVVVIIIMLLGRLLEKFIDMIALGFLDKLAGGVFGILKAGLIISAILLVINTFDNNEKLITPKLKANSLLYPPVASMLPTLLPMINFEEFDNPFKEEIKPLKKA
ncbi:MAG TPA: CvpA family protein [Bacteroidales bacterium]|nr:CvpA family protein [Bacteroidales bacterium]